MKKYILLTLVSLISLTVAAQKPTARATVEPSDILIGEHAKITIEVISPLGRDIRFPIYGDTLVHGIEVLDMRPHPDTTLTEVMTLRQEYLITSFDSTLYHIPHMIVVADGTDTIKTNSFGIKVTSPQLSEQTLEYLEKLNTQQVDSIDFEELQLADVKPIQDAPFVWQDYLGYVLIPLLIALVVLGLALAYYLWRKKRKKGYFFTPKVIEPPHVIALRELDELKAKKMGQRGMEKEYYTMLTDIVRQYIARRYPSINAPEMITEEIVKAIHRQTTEGTSAEEGLEQILELADLVKFAKYIPLQDENDLSMVNAYLFVNQTKVEETLEEKENGKPRNKAKGGKPQRRQGQPTKKN